MVWSAVVGICCCFIWFHQIYDFGCSQHRHSQACKSHNYSSSLQFYIKPFVFYPKIDGFFSALNQACNRVCVLLNKRFFLHFHSKWGSFFMLLRFSCSAIYSNLFYFFIFQTIFSRFEVQKLNSKYTYTYIYSLLSTVSF